ncbi:Na+-driven multidrug efflux pump [Evansella vedderi]|uniref:Na+-driven multidrug efflux pump n=1 Tax=Evansella vedderi TaxID=38282 RepID=A0ABU0A3N1_9BACI|nr:hypothetical protein [Evansella vedderi]MDQ0258105.1 Na+-driven multidrug efflux pump [Evansella vedderi]
MVLTIVVGYSVGAGKIKAAKQYGRLGVWGGIDFLGSGVIFILFP